MTGPFAIFRCSHADAGVERCPPIMMNVYRVSRRCRRVDWQDNSHIVCTLPGQADDFHLKR